MSGYANNVSNKPAHARGPSRWISLKEGTYVFRILPPSSSYFDPSAPPLSTYCLLRKVIFEFPLAEGAKNVVVDNGHIIARALAAYQKTLGDWEMQKKLMKQNGMGKFWPRPRGVYNVITSEKKDRPYWLDLPKTAMADLDKLLSADPVILDLEKGRPIQLIVTGTDQYTRKYAFAVGKVPKALKLEFDASLLDEIKDAVKTTEVDWKEIKEPTIRQWAVKLIKDDMQAKKDEEELAGAGEPGNTKAVAAAPAKTTRAPAPPKDQDDAFQTSPAEDTTGFGSSAGSSEADDAAAFEAELAKSSASAKAAATGGKAATQAAPEAAADEDDAFKV
jgi:hypothetical protein